MTTAFPGWVPFNAETGEQPPDWKTALLVLLGLYPIVLLEIRFLSPMLIHLNPAVSSFINLVGSVVFTTFGTMPRFIRIFSWWMFPRKDAPESVHARGLFIILLLFAAEIGLLWNLLPPQI